MSPLRALLEREVRLAVRAGGGAGLGLAFFLIVTLLAPLGIGPDQTLLAQVAPGLLWVAALLACLLSLDRLFQADHEDGTLDILALSPLPLEGIVAVKMMAHWVTTGLPLVIAAPVLALTLNMPEAAQPMLILGLAIGTPALSAIGAVGAAITVGLRRGGLLLSLLVLPLYVPTLIFGAQIASRAGDGLEAGASLPFLAGISLLSLSAGPFVAAAALRVNLR
ncbi:heme exporter protein CcmB [Pontivivens nitratireducens]|uniref:heme exporter protein CcmB n=1 Tax=Pontivivens nitratireducens TaxID=2758038 RepID=UPI003221D9D3